MGKSFESNGRLMHYVRPEHRKLWREFFRLIKSDLNVIAKKRELKVGNPSIESISITMLVQNYVKLRNPRFALQISQIPIVQ